MQFKEKAPPTLKLQRTKQRPCRGNIVWVFFFMFYGDHVFVPNYTIAHACVLVFSTIFGNRPSFISKLQTIVFMNRLLLSLILIGMGQAAFAQYVYTIKADSVKITNSCDTAELIIENHT